jgi:hypothetical protein
MGCEKIIQNDVGILIILGLISTRDLIFDSAHKKIYLA